MQRRTINIPDDLVPVIDSLGVPLSAWVADQLRRHAATQRALSFGEQVLADVQSTGGGAPTAGESQSVAARMQRSAPWQ